MTKFMVAMPVASEVKEEGRKFAEEVAARRAEFVQSRRRLGVTRERGWLQATPNGDVFILLLEGDDPVEANRKFAASHDPFDVWFKDRAGGILGADFTRPIPVEPEPIYQSAPSEGQLAKEATAVAIPLMPGKTERHRQLAEEVNGPKKEDFDAFQ